MNLAIFLFVILTSGRYISTKLIDTEEVKDQNGDSVEYKHPFLQAVAGYLGEFLIVLVLSLYYKWYSPEKLCSGD